MNDQDNDIRACRAAGLLRAGAYAVGAAALIGAASTAANAQVKKAGQKDAGYQELPMAGKSCSNCRQFQAPSSCTRGRRADQQQWLLPALRQEGLRGIAGGLWPCRRSQPMAAPAR